MAGYGASLEFDEEAMRNLPIGTDKDSRAERRNMFRLADMNGNGITSLAECDRLIVSVLKIKGVSIMKPVINRAFHAARDIVPSVGSISPHYVDFHEFRYFLIYLKHYLELFLIFCASEKGSGRYSDRRLSYPEFESVIPQIMEWGVEDETAAKLQQDPRIVFQEMDANGGGVVLFDEFAHWALWNHMFRLDGEDDKDMEEALSVLKKQKPNLCGKDLAGIKASKAKYRADAKISGQGCLGGDPSLSGGYEDLPKGGAALAAGGHYPGGLAAWKASFHGKGEDRPGLYRAVAQITAVMSDVPKASEKIGEIRNGEEFEVLEVVPRKEDKRIRAKVTSPTEGWISLLNTGNGFRWAIRIGDAAGEKTKTLAWKESLARVAEAGNDFADNGIPECINGCGQPRFGRYPTCCTHCTGAEGPHARSCKGQGYKLCANGCGHPQFGRFETCCTHCTGGEGPHARGCKPAAEEKASAELIRGTSFKDTGRSCCNGCGRAPFRQFKTCCTHCKGFDGPHARDCDDRDQGEGVRRNLRKIFFQHKDKPGGMSYGAFREILSAAGTSDPDDIDALIAASDKNRNGMIEIDEFLEWLYHGEMSDEDRMGVVGGFRDN
eukprot:TRINITY_DN19414_c0_g1_i1.p1 TRINITY_DN19414_c0_g1~~TRINITY_DN19414_c0_g1_i1.p1  ORF type:complete len:607 (-),score=119.67 TRINITY_DN19414_c0_g1_i1:228-2048(-)